ncbi:flavodoxin family protein [Loigolactobacillus iwatensis]|uniref:flavodoxin family protein n=1 Tax=Loigolactobacillus iwatensis TaxID=1267156 RepID=UPI000F7E0A03|nr:flavodoxin family protein [Loigolactobacillus iwatensis]
MKIVLITGSSRQESNSTYLAKTMLAGVPFTELELETFKLRPIVDHRHDWEWPRLIDDYPRLIRYVLAAQVIVFATPIYWYGMSGLMKTFIDHWSESLKLEQSFREKMKGKQIYLVLVGSDQPQEKGQLIVQQFRYICEFLQMTFKSALIGEANRPLEIKNDQAALQLAAQLGHQLNGEGEQHA